ncbi:hypothetical protein TIFTF001_042511 [Ficus carica]|uniref:GDSL esterase/lipase n=1 Tax=Ficus carica TaxID=3494 RepID=A0AA87ZNP3_FICCA|nr:hypothetical protein TIFTF001_042511 [Ficus carica]
MENKTLISLSFGLFLLLITININASSAKEARKHDDHDHHHGSVKKLFVFGDSYADTGNSKKATAVSWKAPYGSAYPGKPAGRFSNGRVLTDYVGTYSLHSAGRKAMCIQPSS